MSGEHFIVCISESVLYSGVLCRGVVNPDQFFFRAARFGERLLWSCKRDGLKGHDRRTEWYWDLARK